MSEDDGWKSHADGFIKGHIGVFPAIPDAWAVWDDFGGEWDQSVPFTAVGRTERKLHPGRNPPYEFIERTREEALTEAKRLAEGWLAKRGAGAPTP